MLYIIPFIVCIFLIASDQCIKYFTVKLLMPIGDIPIINGFFHLTYVENRGAAFGFMEGARWFFIVLTIVITFVMILFYYKIPKEKGTKAIRISIIFIISGAIGNLIDRFFNGYVVDMFHFIFFGYEFPVFNFADILVVCGTTILIVLIVINEDNTNKIFKLKRRKR